MCRSALLPFEQKATVWKISHTKKMKRISNMFLAQLFSVQQHMDAYYKHSITIYLIKNEPYPWALKGSNIWSSQHSQSLPIYVRHTHIWLLVLWNETR